MIPPLRCGDRREVAIEANDLTMRFGDFVAVDHVSFRIRRGEIFGFLGSNGCGKSTTMKMLTGLLPASEGQRSLLGQPVDPKDIATRRRVGYMSQAFSLYTELSVRQNLVLHARLFQMPEAGHSRARGRDGSSASAWLRCWTPCPRSAARHPPAPVAGVAMVHEPELLILDEPTSGRGPHRARQPLATDDRPGRATIRSPIFISTHFMNEAGRCDRISLDARRQRCWSPMSPPSWCASAAPPRWNRPSSPT